MPNKRNDVSNQTVVVLLVLTLLVTVVSTWLMLDALTGAAATPLDESRQQAKVSFTLIEPPVSTQTAEVGFELITPQE